MVPQKAQSLIQELFPSDTKPACIIKLWNGDNVTLGSGPPAFTVTITSADRFDKLLTSPSLAFGEGYINGEIQIEGDLKDVLAWLYKYSLEDRFSLFQKAKLCWLHLKKKASIKQAKEDVSYHYDKGNDFYKLWLDKGMNYSCAFFTKEDQSLEEAQRNKIIRSLKKLRLKKGHKILDIGCGWGSLVITAAEEFGANAVGITLSKNQYELARKRVNDKGLEKQVDIRLQDYREIPKEEFGTYDRIISIGMFEHVGKENIRTFFEVCSKLLRDKGVLLLHTIGRTKEKEMDAWLTKYIFPGTYLPSLGELFETAEDTGFDFVDLENLRRHYDKTLGHWAERFEKNVKKITKMYDEKFVRMWRLYLNACQMAFRFNPLHVFQLLFSKGRRNDWPLVRESLYIQ